ncbi:ABC-2 family transporter protein [Candidatus Dojkabacteria bacterium]|nr:ABC-2 family transporter protein [Candidatus Dojkabacteria bacterium]
MKNFVKNIKFVWSVFKVNLGMWSVYRLKLVVWVVSGVVEPLVWSILWFVTAQESQSMVLSGTQILNYYLFIALVDRITRSWTFDTLRKVILTGEYNKYLLWPKNVTLFRLGADLSNKFVSILALLPIWMTWFFILQFYGLIDVINSNILFFAIALILASLIRFYLDLILAHIALWWEKIEGVSSFYWVAVKLFGGVTVPLVLLPNLAFNITKVLPFRYGMSFPVEILLGISDKSSIVWGFGMSLFWIVIEIIVYKLMIKYGLKKYESIA